MMKRQRIEIKERDEWSGIAELLGNIIAKYADVVDLDDLPEPDIYLTQNRMKKMYKRYMEISKLQRKRKNGLTILIYGVKLFVGANKV